MKDSNERRLLTAVALSLAMVFMWQRFFGPPPPDDIPADPAAIVSAEAPAGTPVASPAGTPDGSGDPAAVPAAQVAEAPCTGAATAIRSETAELEVTDCGGVRAVRLLGVPSAITAHSWWGWAYDRVTGHETGGWTPYTSAEGDLNLLDDGELLAAGQGAYALGGTWAVTSTDPLVQTRTTPNGLRIQRTIRKGSTADTWDVSVRFEADKPLSGPLWIGVAGEFSAQSGRSPTNAGLLAVADGSLKPLTDPVGLSAAEELKVPVGWFGVADRFYLAALAPKDPGAAVLHWDRVDPKRVGGFIVLPASTVGPGAPVEQSFVLYVGPREIGRLEAAGNGFDKASSLGFFGLFAKFLLITLHLIHDGLGNWGYSILALTLLVRMVTYPLTRSAVMSGRKMQALQPELKKLQEQFKDDKEALNRETMALWSKNGVNPVGGCLPMVIQMPIFFALYSALAYEPSLFHAKFAYLHDLSAQDPYGILGLFVVAGMYAQQLITPTPGMDPTQVQMMRLMPLVFGGMMFSAPAGLSLYYSLNTVLAILQQWYNTRSMPPVIPSGDANVRS